jgi:hypothetical protein
LTISMTYNHQFPAGIGNINFPGDHLDIVGKGRSTVGIFFLHPEIGLVAREKDKIAMVHKDHLAGIDPADKKLMTRFCQTSFANRVVRKW